MIRYVVLYFTTKVYNILHAHFMHRLYTAPECHQTQTFGVCMNEVNSHMRRTKRRLLPLRRVQSTDARHVTCTHPLTSVAYFASY
ncbi:unnamed protein product [Musa hybrid cultivar]